MWYSNLIGTLPRALALIAVAFLTLADGAGVAQDVEIEIGDVGESCWTGATCTTERRLPTGR